MAEKYRSKGCSNQLLGYAEEFFRKKGMSEYHLKVSVTNERAIRFYKKNGMTILKEEKSSVGYQAYRLGKALV